MNYPREPIVVPLAINTTNATAIILEIITSKQSLLTASDATQFAVESAQRIFYNPHQRLSGHQGKDQTVRDYACENGGNIHVRLSAKEQVNDNDVSLISTNLQNCNYNGYALSGDIELLAVPAQQHSALEHEAYDKHVLVNQVSYSIRHVENAENVNADIYYTFFNRDKGSAQILSGSLFSITREDGSRTLSDFSLARTSKVEQGKNRHAIAVSGTIDSAHLGGLFSFQTVQQYVGNNASRASIGTMSAIGAQNTSVRLIALSESEVKLLIDSNGDGRVNHSMISTWQNLLHTDVP